MHTVQFDWLVPDNASQQLSCSAAAGGQVHGCSRACCLLLLYLLLPLRMPTPCCSRSTSRCCSC